MSEWDYVVPPRNPDSQLLDLPAKAGLGFLLLGAVGWSLVQLLHPLLSTPANALSAAPFSNSSILPGEPPLPFPALAASALLPRPEAPSQRQAGVSAERDFSVVVAASTPGRCIGWKGGMPWPVLPGDIAFFKQLTCSAPAGRTNALVMGRKTWDSLPASVRPLPSRLNYVVSANGQLAHNTSHVSVIVCSSFAEALAKASADLRVATIFVIGGAQMYAEAFKSPRCCRIHLTQVMQDYPCDTFLPPIDTSRFVLSKATEIKVENGVPYRFLTFETTS
eukprot:g21766.t1